MASSPEPVVFASGSESPSFRVEQAWRPQPPAVPALSQNNTDRPPANPSNAFSPGQLSLEQRDAMMCILGGRNTVVKAVAGAGKTRTALTTAIEFLKQHPSQPTLGVVFIAYNRRLRQDLQQVVDHQVEPSFAARIFIHTYYSLRAAYFGLQHQAALHSELLEEPSSDFERTLQSTDAARMNPVPTALKIRGTTNCYSTIGLVVLDEAQDMTPNHHHFLIQWLTSMAIRRLPTFSDPVMMLVGDPCQLVYGYRSASVHFMFRPDDAFRRRRTPQGTSLIRDVPFCTCLLSESYRVGVPVANWVNENLNPANLAAHYTSWASDAGAAHVAWWASGVRGLAPATLPVIEIRWQRHTGIAPDARSLDAERERQLVGALAAFDEAKQDAMKKLGLVQVDDIVSQIQKYGPKNTAIVAVTLKQLWSEARLLASAIPFSSRIIVNGEACSEGDVDVTSITSFKGLERDLIIMVGCDGGLEPMYHGDPGALLNQFYVGATRARCQLVVARHADKPAFATMRTTKDFFSWESLSDEQRQVVDVVVRERRNCIVNAVAGSGKTRTALTAAMEFIRSKVSEPLDVDDDDARQNDGERPVVVDDEVHLKPASEKAWKTQHRVLIVAYNKRLERDMASQADARLPGEIRNVVKISTIHAMVNAYFNDVSVEVKDVELREVAELRKPLLCVPKNLRLIIIDEAQDLTKPLVDFLRYFMALLPSPPQLVVCGDVFQMIYGFRQASGNYLIFPESTWQFEGRPVYRMPRPTDKLPDKPFFRVRLSVSYRITHEMAAYVNRHLNPNNFAALDDYKAWWGRHGECVKDMWDDGIHADPSRPVAPDSVKYITVERRGSWLPSLAAELMDALTVHSEHDSVILASSVSAHNCPVRLLATVLKEQVWTFLTSSDDLDDSDVASRGLRPEHKNKRVATTIHQMKGLERDLVVVVGFDSFREDMYLNDPLSLFNLWYVALTRAKKHLVVVRWNEVEYATHEDRIRRNVPVVPKAHVVKDEPIEVTRLARSMPVAPSTHDLGLPESWFAVTPFPTSGVPVRMSPTDFYIASASNSRGEPTADNVSALYGVAVEVRLQCYLDDGVLAVPASAYQGCDKDFRAAVTDLHTEVHLRKKRFHDSNWGEFLRAALVIYSNDHAVDYFWRQTRGTDLSLCPTEKLERLYRHTVRLLHAAVIGGDDHERAKMLSESQQHDSPDPCAPFETKYLDDLKVLYRSGRLCCQRDYLTKDISAWSPKAEMELGAGVIGITDYVLLPLQFCPRAMEEMDGSVALRNPNGLVVVELKTTRRGDAKHRIQLALYGALMQTTDSSFSGVGELVVDAPKRPECRAGSWPDMFLLYAGQASLQRLHVRIGDSDSVLSNSVTQALRAQTGRGKSITSDDAGAENLAPLFVDQGVCDRSEQ